MGNTLSLTSTTRCAVRTTRCADGFGMCVSLKHGLVIVAGFDDQLYLYSLEDGSLVRCVGRRGRGEGQFSLFLGGLCVSPDGDSVLVAESFNERVQEVRIADGSWVRFLGVGVLRSPEFVDADAAVVAVSEGCGRVSLLSWHDGSVFAQVGSEGSAPGQLHCPRGLRLLADGTGVVVADSWNNRLSVFSLVGEFVRVVGSKDQGLKLPRDVLECSSDGGFVVMNDSGRDIVKVSAVGEVLETYRAHGRDVERPFVATAFAAVPDWGLIVREDSCIRMLGVRSVADSSE